MQPRWHEPSTTAEGELLQHVLNLEQIVKMRKSKNCMGGCKSDDCPSCSKKASKAGQIKVTDADRHNNKVFADIMGDGDEDAAYKNYEEASEMDRKGEFKPNRGDEKKPTLKGRGGMESNFDLDKTAEFLASKGVIVKYEQEGDVENGVPTFMDHSGGVAVQARPFQTNGTIPDFNNKAPNTNGISEVAKMPAFAKTGYDEKGSGLHMQLIDGGDRKDGNWNIAPIEERLTELKKGYGKPGLIEEIASLMESVAKRL